MLTSFEGPPIDDSAILDRLPEDIANCLKRRNGFITANGGFHVRGACIHPAWHSLRAAWEDNLALHRLYPEVLESDVPLAEDCFGDQFLLRDSQVIRLVAETGEIEEANCNWPEFLAGVEADPVGFLNLWSLGQFQEEFGPLPAGSLIHAYPPFVTVQGSNPSLRAISALELRVFHADFARQIRGIPDGGKIEIKVL